MIELVKQRSIEGLHDELTVKTINQYFPYDCVSCAIGGMRRKPISSNLHGHRVVPDGIGDEIEIDILYNQTGNGITTDGATFSGCKYAAISIDRSSKFMHGHLLKDMDNILEIKHQLMTEITTAE